MGVYAGSYGSILCEFSGLILTAHNEVQTSVVETDSAGLANMLNVKLFFIRIWTHISLVVVCCLSADWTNMARVLPDIVS